MSNELPDLSGINPSDWRAEIWNAAIEAAALVVQPIPHVEEERTCGEVAEQIRRLKMS